MLTFPELSRQMDNQAWLKRFTNATVEVGHLSDDALLLAASSRIHENTPFGFSINKKPPQTYSDFLERARKLRQCRGLDFKEVRGCEDLPRKPRRRPADGDEVTRRESCGLQPIGPRGEEASRLRSWV